jgi:hypothetical protein
VGVHVATFVVELYDNVVAIAEPPEGVSVKMIDPLVTASLNVAVMVLFVATFVAPDAGVSAVTVGITGGTVVNVQVTGEAITSPPASVAPLTLAAYVVPAFSAAVGVQVATFVVEL